jgi:hypothetical protein
MYVANFGHVKAFAGSAAAGPLSPSSATPAFTMARRMGAMRRLRPMRPQERWERHHKTP